MPGGDDRAYSEREVAKILNVTDTSLRACLRAALLPLPTRTRPVRCTFQELLLLKTTKSLLDAQIPLARIRRILQSLKRQLPDDQQLWNVTIYADGRRVVVWDGTARWQPDSGQFLFNFDPQTVASALHLRHPPKAEPARTAQQWLELGLELESDSPEEACHAYRQALDLQPSLSAAHLQLGRLSEVGQPDLAECSYRAAAQHAPKDCIPCFCLATLLQARGKRAEAIQAYEDALARKADFQEAHYHLALMYEADGHTLKAIRHFSAAKQLLRRPGAPGRRRPGH